MGDAVITISFATAISFAIVTIVLTLISFYIMLSIFRDRIGKKQEEFHIIQHQRMQMLQDGIASSLQNILQSQSHSLDLLYKQLNDLTKNNDDKMESIRSIIDKKLWELGENNSNKLEKIRITVEEKLQSTLEKRLSESFQIISQRLETVHRGLGEMKHLADGVGDLKKVLTNVKVRGIWSEIQLANIIEQMLTPSQYMINVPILPGSQDRVEFAIKLPGKDPELNHILLPIDAKFPLSDYQRLHTAQENGDVLAVNTMTKALETSIRKAAKTIATKYIALPYSTDFAIMFLPIEGLYSEVLRISGLVETLQQEWKIIITGPTTFSAILNSLQMGFRTLAIEQRSSEVWKVLGAIKGEFATFSQILIKTRAKIEQAGKEMLSAERSSKKIEKKLGDLENTQSDTAIESYDNSINEIDQFTNISSN